MITFKSTEDLSQLPPTDPAYPTVKELIEDLITACTWEGQPWGTQWGCTDIAAGYRRFKGCYTERVPLEIESAILKLHQVTGPVRRGIPDRFYDWSRGQAAVEGTAVMS
jgi:hypothetical protein